MHLISLRLALVVLDVDPGIAYSWHLEDQMAGTRLTRLAEKFLARHSEIGEPQGRIAFVRDFFR